MSTTRAHIYLAPIMLALGVYAATAAGGIPNSASPDPVPLVKNYSCSWLGNTFAGRSDDHQWIQSWAYGMAVAGNGAVYLTSFWEESGRRGGIYKDGREIGQAEYRDGLEPSGQYVAVNGTHAFYSHDKGILRYGLDGKNPTMVIQDVGGEIMGVAASEKRIAVSVFDGRILLFDLTGQKIAEFAAPHPGTLALGPGDIVYATINVTRSDENDPPGRHNKQWLPDGEPMIARFDAHGVEQKRSAVIKPNWAPSSVAIDHSTGRIIVASAGRDQQIYFLDPVDLTLRKTFGVENGYLAGPMPGTVGPQRLMRPWGAGTDLQGNLYVFNFVPHTAVGRVVLQKYSPDGKLVWNLDGLAWVDSTDILPGTDGKTIFTGSDTFRYDYDAPVTRNKSPYRHETVTADPWTYPIDSRDHSPFVVQIGGKTFMFTIGQFCGAINIHRFDGHIAVPAGQIHRQGKQQELWIDTNGDGQRQDDEVTTGGPDAGENFAAFVDDRGDIWDCNYDSSRPDWTDRWTIRRFVMQGVNAKGVPIYRWDKVDTFANPAHLYEIGRIQYFPQNDTMYLMGFTQQYPRENDLGHGDPTPWGSAGRVLYRYDHWTASNRTLHAGYPLAVAYHVKTSLGNGSGMARPAAADEVTADMENSQIPVDFAVLGNTASQAKGDGYVFIVWGTNGPSTLTNQSRNEIRIYNTSDASLVGAMIAKDPLEPATLGWLDTRRALKGVRRANGEYVLITEEDNRSKYAMYRWKP